MTAINNSRAASNYDDSNLTAINYYYPNSRATSNYDDSNLTAINYYYPNSRAASNYDDLTSHRTYTKRSDNNNYVIDADPNSRAPSVDSTRHWRYGTNTTIKSDDDNNNNYVICEEPYSSASFRYGNDNNYVIHSEPKSIDYSARYGNTNRTRNNDNCVIRSDPNCRVVDYYPHQTYSTDTSLTRNDDHYAVSVNPNYTTIENPTRANNNYSRDLYHSSQLLLPNKYHPYNNHRRIIHQREPNNNNTNLHEQISRLENEIDLLKRSNTLKDINIIELREKLQKL